MPLREGDSLVCNADPNTVRLGLTNPETLQRFLNMGVRLFTVTGLHAKVLVGADFAWVGSANASDSGLIDASIRVGKTDSRPIRSWAETLCIEPHEITPQSLDHLCTIEVRPRGTIKPPPEAFPDLMLVTKVQLWDFADYMSAEAEEAASGERIAETSRPARLAMRRWRYTQVEKDDDRITEGDWIIPIYWGRPSRPAQIVRITPQKDFKIVWYWPTRTPKIPRISDIRRVLPTLDDLWSDDGYAAIEDERLVKRIVSLYM